MFKLKHVKPFINLQINVISLFIFHWFIHFKGDENKELLLQLQTCDHILRLLKSEDKVIRRNAVMVLAVLCYHPEVRKALKDEESVIPSLLGLLSSNGEIDF